MIPDYSIAVFPFLKTRQPVTVGDVALRSTDDTSDLAPAQAESVREIAEMLFLRDDLRIESSTYTVVPYINFGAPSPDANKLSIIQDVISYMYCAPQPADGHPFLATEHASLAIFVPERVSRFLVSPEFHTVKVGDGPDVQWDERGHAPGYAGLYNFKHPFWVAKGSRIYGPLPRLTLNHSQDLSIDVVRFAMAPSVRLDLLLALLDRPETAVASRILTAVRWYNEAHKSASGEDGAIANLATAFEALFALPQSDKTERLVDAISLLLGRTARLDLWAAQFYKARSKVVHEGRAPQLRFVTPGGSAMSAEYQPLLAYGTRIFRLCLATVLVGANLAEEAGLANRFVTNQERFQQISRILDAPDQSPAEKLAATAPLVDIIDEHRFVGESSLRPDAIVGAIRRAAAVLLATGIALSPSVASTLERMAQSSGAELEALEALNALESELPLRGPNVELPLATIAKLADIGWHYLFQLYFWLLERSGQGKED
jgi:hypothetical protein